MPLFGPPDIAKLLAKRDVSGLIKALGYPKDEDVRRAAAQALGQLADTRGLEPLVAVMGDPSNGIRLAAIEALGHFGAPAARPLIAALGDGSGPVRAAAAGALVQIGAPAVELLRVILGGENLDARRLAAGVLDKLAWSPDRGESGAAYWVIKGDWAKCVDLGAPAVPPLIVTLRDLNVRSDPAAAALVEIGVPAVELLIVALREVRDWHVRYAVAGVLGRIGDPRAVESLIAALRDREVVRAAARALVQIGDPRAVEPLIAALNDPSACSSAATALGDLRDVRAVEPLIAALAGADAGGRSAIAEALGKLGDARAVEALIPALTDREAAGIHTMAARALGQIGDPRAAQPLMAALKDEKDFVRLAVAEALGQIGDAGAAESLTAALQDPSPRVRAVAAAALERLAATRDPNELASVRVAEAPRRPSGPAPDRRATDLPPATERPWSDLPPAVGDIVVMTRHYEFDDATSPVLLAGPDRGLDGTEWRVQRIATEPSYVRVGPGIMQKASEPHVELVLVAGQYRHWAPFQKSELPADLAAATAMRAKGKTVAEQPGYTMTLIDSDAYRRHFPDKPVNQQFLEEWRRADRRSASLVNDILAHPSPVVFGTVNKDVQASLDELQKEGDAPIQPILSAVRACGSGDSEGAYWWKGAQELCSLLGRLGSAAAKDALLQILETDSRIVEYEYVRASAAQALAGFRDPELLPRLLRCLELPNAPVLAINKTIVALGGDASSLPRVIVAQGRDIRDLQEAVRFYRQHQPRVASWPNREDQGGFYFLFGAGVEKLRGTEAARPLLAASLAANPAATAAAWSAFPLVAKSPENAQELAEQYPLTAPYLASVDAPDERPAPASPTLAEKAQSEKWQLRRSYAEDPQADPKKLEDLIRNDPTEEVRTAACANPNTPPRVLEEFGTLGSAPLAAIVAAMSRHGRERGLWETVAANPNTPLPVLERLAGLEISPGALQQVAPNDRETAAFFVERILWGIAENPCTPISFLERLGRDPEYRIRIRAAGNRSTPLQVLQALARDPNERIRKAAEENPSFRPG